VKPQSKKPNVEWEETIIPLGDPKSCKHYFEFNERMECRCKHCGFGLWGVADIKNGKPI